MREALAPYLLQLTADAVVHQWAPKQYVQRSSCMPEAHARVYREHAAQHAQQLFEAGPVPSCSSAAVPKCAPGTLSARLTHLHHAPANVSFIAHLLRLLRIRFYVLPCSMHTLCIGHCAGKRFKASFASIAMPLSTFRFVCAVSMLTRGSRCRSDTTDGKPRSGHDKLLEAFISLYQIAQHPLLGTSHYSTSRHEIQTACGSVPRASFADVLRAPDDLDSFDALPDITAHNLCCKVPSLGHLKLPVRLPPDSH